MLIASGGLSGGISSSIAGGNFWAGARQGVITSVVNHLAHSVFSKRYEIFDNSLESESDCLTCPKNAKEGDSYKSWLDGTNYVYENGEWVVGPVQIIGGAGSLELIGGGALKGGMALLKGVKWLFKWKGAAKGGKSFFEGTKYTNKVLGQMKKGDFHGFPENVKTFESSGVISTIKGGDGVTRQMLKIPGEYKGKKGFFEFMKEADGTINHRLFRPNP